MNRNVTHLEYFSSARREHSRISFESLRALGAKVTILLSGVFLSRALCEEISKSILSEMGEIIRIPIVHIKMYRYTLKL